jgi:hypothetical protein
LFWLIIPATWSGSSASLGSYGRDRLIARFGGDIALPDLLVALASCQCGDDLSRRCGARYPDLAVRA